MPCAQLIFCGQVLKDSTSLKDVLKNVRHATSCSVNCARVFHDYCPSIRQATRFLAGFFTSWPCVSLLPRAILNLLPCELTDE
eukprot:1187857-Prorocentrum_minimum.AAC.3